MRWPLLTVLFFALGAPSLHADSISVAAAADLQPALQEIAAAFEKQTGHKVNVTYGSSGNFFAQIQNGAPFDLFFSADIGYPRKLEAAGLAEPGTLYNYALGRIVIWVRRDSSVDVYKGWHALLDPSVQKIAIANPKHAPYGRAAVAALQRAGIYDNVEGKLVFGENISQAAQFVASGNAQAGILALSLARAPAMRNQGRHWEIPSDAHPPIEQWVIVLKSSPSKNVAREFLEYVKTAPGRAVLERYGFEVPPASAPASSRP
jgi:molybdate transport system substrate-binding protein